MNILVKLFVEKRDTDTFTTDKTKGQREFSPQRHREHQVVNN